MAPVKRGLKRGLKERKRTVILMLDETIVTETPPLYNCYGPVGKQVEVPITGNRSTRIIHGVLNIHTGGILLLVTELWDQYTHQYFLSMIRAHWRGWNIVLFEDRGSPHKADETIWLARALNIELRFLPKATPELNAMDHLWRHVKEKCLASRPTRSIAQSADDACQYLLQLTPQERLRLAGILSGDFWLTK